MGQHNTIIKLVDLEGKWFINQSNFPMWTKGKKTSPTFNYSILLNKQDTTISDRVEYFKKGKKQSINGIDKPLNTSNSEFIWRGKGVLSVLKSKWSILYLDKENQWAIIYFEKTLFTPEGYDIISRNALLRADVEQKVKDKLSELGITQILKTIVHIQN